MGNAWLDKFQASGLGWAGFLLGQGLIGCGWQLSGPERPQVLV